MTYKLDLFKHIFFVNISRHYYDDTNFEWISPNFLRSTFFECKLTRNAPDKGIYYCISKSDIKLVYYVKNDVVFTMGAHPDVQSLLMEILLEYLINVFFKTFDETLLSTSYGEKNHIFNSFNDTIKYLFNNYENLDLFRTALIRCNGCNKTLKIIIKKSLIENYSKPTIPLVYIHSGHAVIVYVDKNYAVRGNELVTVSY